LVWEGSRVKGDRQEDVPGLIMNLLIFLSSPAHIPLIGVDAWEHAFYLQYKNVKADYFKAIWEVINFAKAEERMKQA